MSVLVSRVSVCGRATTSKNTADRVARAAGTVYRVVAGTESLDKAAPAAGSSASAGLQLANDTSSSTNTTTTNPDDDDDSVSLHNSALFRFIRRSSSGNLVPKVSLPSAATVLLLFP